jgi:hypothetical protein
MLLDKISIQLPGVYLVLHRKFFVKQTHRMRQHLRQGTTTARRGRRIARASHRFLVPALAFQLGDVLRDLSLLLFDEVLVLASAFHDVERFRHRFVSREKIKIRLRKEEKKEAADV